MAAAPLVCIISQGSQALVEEERLLTAGARVRCGSSSSPGCDLLFSRAGVTLAFLLLSAQEVAGGTAGGGGEPSAACTARLELLAKSFKHGYVLLPYEAHGNAAALAVKYAHEPRFTFVYMPLCASFAAQALAITQAVLEARTEEAAWRQQQEQVVTTAEAVQQVLAGLPLPPDCDRMHCTHMLRMLGSLQQLSQASAADIAAHTDLPPHAAQQVAAFFRREPMAAAAAALQPARPTLAMLRSL